MALEHDVSLDNKPLLYGKHCRGPGCDDFNEQKPQCWCTCDACLKPKDPAPVPMLLWCPECHRRHLDVGAFATKTHHTHACQHCGHCWRPAVVPTVGVQFLPGFKND